MRNETRILPLLGLVTVMAGGGAMGSPVNSVKSNHPTAAPSTYSNKAAYPVVFTLVTPGVFNVNYAQLTPPAPVTKPGDRIPVPKHVVKGKKY